MKWDFCCVCFSIAASPLQGEGKNTQVCSSGKDLDASPSEGRRLSFQIRSTRMQPKQKRRKHLLEDSYKLCPLKGIISFQRLFLFSSSKIFHHLLFTSCNRIRGSPQTIFMVPKLEAVFSHFSSPRLMIQPELIRAQSRWDHKQNRSLDPSRSRPAAHRPTSKQKQKWDEPDPLWVNKNNKISVWFWGNAA